MKFRIKTEIKESGEKQYIPQIQNPFGWEGMCPPVNKKSYAKEFINFYKNEQIARVKYEYLD